MVPPHRLPGSTPAPESSTRRRLVGAGAMLLVVVGLLLWWFADRTPPARLVADVAAPLEVQGTVAAAEPLQREVAAASSGHDAAAAATAPVPAFEFAFAAFTNDAWGLPGRVITASFGLADGAVLEYGEGGECLPDGSKRFHWRARAAQLDLVVDTGHLRVVPLRAGQPARVQLDAVLELSDLDEAGPPPPPPAETELATFGARFADGASFLEASEGGEGIVWSETGWDSQGPAPATGRLYGSVHDAEGRAASDFVVRADFPGQFLVANTRRDGTYEFPALPHGTHVITAGGRNGGTASMNVTIDAASLALDLKFTDGPAVRGRVVDTSGAAVADARVLWWQAEGEWRNRVVTGRDGTFVVPEVRDAPGWLWVCVPGKQLCWPAVGRQLVPGSDVAEFVLDRTTCKGSLRVHTQVPIGVDPHDVTVRAWQAASGLGVRMARTDEPTTFALVAMPAGHYTLEVVCPGLGVLRTGSYWVDGQGCCEVPNLCLAEPGRVQVRMADDRPAPREFELVRHGTAVDVRVQMRAPLEGPHLLAAGDYSLWWRETDGSVQHQPFPVARGTQTLTLRSAPAASGPR